MVSHQNLVKPPKDRIDNQEQPQQLIENYHTDSPKFSSLTKGKNQFTNQKLTPAKISFLQHTVGNQAVQRLINNYRKYENRATRSTDRSNLALNPILPATELQRIQITFQVGKKKPETIETNEYSPTALLQILKQKTLDEQNKLNLINEIKNRIRNITDKEILAEMAEGKYSVLRNYVENELILDPTVLDNRVVKLYDTDEKRVTETVGKKGAFTLATLTKNSNNEKGATNSTKLLELGNKAKEEEIQKEGAALRVGIWRYCESALDFCEMVKRASAKSEKVNQANSLLVTELIKIRDEIIEEPNDRFLMGKYISVLLFHKKFLRPKLLTLVELMEQEGLFKDSDLGKEEKSVDQEWEENLEKRRTAVAQALTPSMSRVASYFGGCKLKYRGSLATGWRSYPKSQDDIAQRTNLGAFDVDAFIEVKKDVWESWVRLHFITGRFKDVQKINLVDLDKYVELNQGSYDLRLTLKALLAEESFMARKLGEIEGYKKKDGEVDFKLVVQSEEKSESEELYGNPYPPGQLKNAGLRFKELLLEHRILAEDGIALPIATFMPEKHIEITK